MFSVEETVAAPVDLVWRHLTEPALMESWMPGITGLRSRDGKPLAAQSQLVFTARGAERTTDVIEHKENEVIALRSVQGPFTATYRYRLRETATGTIVSLDADCTATGLAALIAPLVRTLARKVDSVQLVKLSAAIDTRNQEHENG